MYIIYTPSHTYILYISDTLYNFLKKITSIKKAWSYLHFDKVTSGAQLSRITRKIKAADIHAILFAYHSLGQFFYKQQ